MRSFIIILLNEQAILGHAVVRHWAARVLSEKQKRRPQAPFVSF
jgi:hypothetical protein